MESKHMNRRSFLRLAVVATAGAGLAACGATPTATPLPKPTAVPPTATKPPAPTVAPTPQQLKGTMFFFSWALAEDMPDKLKAEFAKVYPGITMNVERGTGVDTYLQPQKVRFLAGPGVMDVTDIRPETIADYQKAGYLMDLTDAIALWKDRFAAGLFERATINGKIYCTPDAIDLVGMWYNKKMFADRGLSAPKTWDEFIKVLDSFKSAGVYPLVNGGKTQYANEFMAYPFLHKVFVNDTQIFDKIANGQAKYTDAVWVDAFKQIQQFYKAGYFDPNVLSYTTTDAANMFFAGKAPMYLMGDWTAGSVGTGEAPIGNANVGVFPIASPGMDKIVVPVTVGSWHAINNASNVKPLCLAFLEWLSTPAGAAFVAKGNSKFSPVKGIAATLPLHALFQPLLTGYPSVDFFYNRQASAANSEMTKGLQDLFLGKVTPEDLCANIQKAQSEQK